MPLEVIADADDLHRRLAPGWVTGGVVNSAAFKRNGVPDDEVSVDLARLTTPEKTLQDRPDFGIGNIVAGAVRRCGFDAVHDPLEENPAHSLIRGNTSKAGCRLLAEQMVVIIAPRPGH